MPDRSWKCPYCGAIKPHGGSPCPKAPIRKDTVPYALWKTHEHYIISKRTEPQHMGKPIGKFPRTTEGKVHAMLFAKLVLLQKDDLKDELF